jgi:hypothetical protein
VDTEKIVAKYGTDITKLNIANVRKWIRALRSGKYHKTEGVLYETKQGQKLYCALGVAAKVSGLHDNFLRDNSQLPEESQEWLGVEDSNPTVGDLTIIDRNDDHDQSFKRIANAIEHYWIKPYEKFRHCFLKQKKGVAK